MRTTWQSAYRHALRYELTLAVSCDRKTTSSRYSTKTCWIYESAFPFPVLLSISSQLPSSLLEAPPHCLRTHTRLNADISLLDSTL